jgi:hypothetical protein
LLVAKVKTLDGCKWHPAEKYWSFPNKDDIPEKILKTFEGEEVHLDPALQDRLPAPVIARPEGSKQSQTCQGHNFEDLRREADNWNGKLLNQSLLMELARHHIFPKDFLENELKIDDPDDGETLINNLGNITFIHKDINSEVGEDAPEKYMKKYIESAKKHFISTLRSTRMNRWGN